ncbi:MAG: LysM peptidoglycan-binding domain-containing protein [Burkholderiaceae bacterium]|nr:LysM peptidoglycan-binding domain-containing protein [Burkholderiaceae bacterium]MBY0468201.1 LysM peptidoglycan-binding domain-containing protein [Burkholderiaceae bacterium]
MTRSAISLPARSPRLSAFGLCMLIALGSAATASAEPNFPISAQQRETAQKVAGAGVALSELAPNAPESHTVKAGDTLWGISGLFLKSPWRWPELWGMNLDQIRNPHLIYPGQVLYLDTSDGRARLRLGQAVDGGVVKLSPQVRSSALTTSAITSIPFHLIEPFLNEAVILEANTLDDAPRIVATREGRVLMARGDTAYVRGNVGKDTVFRIFRQAKPLRDPTTKEILGYEAPYVGTAEFVRSGDRSRVDEKESSAPVPDSFIVTSIRQDANVGDRLAPVTTREYSNYMPHAPQGELTGQIVSVYGEAVMAGQNQIVTLNRGKGDGVERGHVLALWQDGQEVVDRTGPTPTRIKLPDERHGMLFVFQVFERMSYALILSVKEPVRPGDRFTQP